MPKTAKGYGSNLRVTEKVRRAIDLWFAEPTLTITALAKKAGITRQHLSRQINGNPEVANVIRQRAGHRLGTVALVKASANLERLIEASTSEYVQLDAAKFTLGVNGVKPVSEPLRGEGGIVITIITPGGRVARFDDDGAPVIDHEPSPALPAPAGPPVSKRDRRVLDANSDSPPDLVMVTP